MKAVSNRTGFPPNRQPLEPSHKCFLKGLLLMLINSQTKALLCVQAVSERAPPNIVAGSEASAVSWCPLSLGWWVLAVVQGAYPLKSPLISCFFNPFSAPACKILGWMMHGGACKQYIFWSYHRWYLASLTPSVPQPVKFGAEWCTEAPASSIFSGPISSIFSAMRFDGDPSPCQCRKEDKKA